MGLNNIIIIVVLHKYCDLIGHSEVYISRQGTVDLVMVTTLICVNQARPSLEGNT